MNSARQISNKSIHQDPAKYGSIQIKTDKLTYYAGESVSGDIYIEILEECPEVQLLLRFEGREAVSVVNVVTYGTGKQRKMLLPNKRIILSEEQNIFTWDTLSPGQYIVPFSFLLPYQISASFYEEYTNIYSAYVRYKLRVSLKSDKSFGMHMMNDVNIVIRDRSQIALQPITQELKTPLTTYWCCSQGETSLKLHIEKNYFKPGEIARAAVEFDNSTSKLDNEKITFAFKQRLRLTNGYVSKRCTKICAAQMHNGLIPAGSQSTNLAFEITLPGFKGDDHELDVGGNKWPTGGDTDIGTTTESRFISSQYYLEVSCPMKGGSTFARVVCPIQIEYPDPKDKEIVLPSNWEPKHLLRVNVAFMFNKGEKRMDKEGEGPNAMVNSGMPSENII